MYPEINRLIRLLHARRISSFLVTNAQFPDRIRRAAIPRTMQADSVFQDFDQAADLHDTTTWHNHACSVTRLLLERKDRGL
jgi:hypothetical protein